MIAKFIFQVVRILKGCFMGALNVFPDNRFVALNEFLKILRLKKPELDALFKVLSNANCGFFHFRICDLSIDINIGSGESITEDEEDWVQVKFEMSKNNIEKSAIYTFKIMELKTITEKQNIIKELK